ncbi:DUF3784 domain-containing protein [uncultured Akkermansia sp.]|uniref:DUF3784 domain-containing protein n=1 Tax=uncultured Akkermansia sp. TaxID=512294 RepID=UPI0027DB77A0|nr:DUF3784 domain-containing protein [uncultured Akkermansia sp.]
MDAPLLIPVVIMGVFIFLGIILSMGKCSFLIAGYNTLSREKKERYDERALCRFTGRLMFFLAFCMLISIISIILESPVLLSIAVFLFVVSITFAIIYANTGNRFRK